MMNLMISSRFAFVAGMDNAGWIWLLRDSGTLCWGVGLIRSFLKKFFIAVIN
jgi:hypothetical protein